MKAFGKSSFPKKKSTRNREPESMTPEEKVIPATPQARMSSVPTCNFSRSGNNS